MAKFHFALALLFVAFAVMGSEARQRGRPIRLVQRTRKLARQEVEIPVTPYPTADELKPDVPFEDTFPADEPIPEEAFVPAGSDPIPDEVIPDEVYGPPEVAVVYSSPDEVYGPPEVDVNALPADVAFARQRALKAKKARLVQVRRQAAYRQAKLAKLRAVKKIKA